MSYVARGLDTYYEKHQEYPKDIALRKKIIKDWYITRVIASIDKCATDKSRILSDTTTKIYREREYNTNFVVLDNLPIEEPFREEGWLTDCALTEYIYYNSTIPYIYHLRHLEFIKDYKYDYPLSCLKLLYPAKMPTKDYFPFIEFELGTEIPFIVTERERKEEPTLPDGIMVEEDVWCLCIVWIDKDRMFISLDYIFYYFKQVGKNVHLFKLRFQ